MAGAALVFFNRNVAFEHEQATLILPVLISFVIEQFNAKSTVLLVCFCMPWGVNQATVP